ncbi:MULTISPECIES: sensor domain-containing diguanylate cyclase [Pseudomonas]|uniref:sensor domain-containing diguanylate cyclase n=1 Tax=Pseudomonas TaxID=286 RepID=UPI0006725E53|nr:MULTISPECIES: sensor domain-containing diguanylate cyclase [Pseudomonas]
MRSARQTDEETALALAGQGRAVALFRLVLAFMLVVMTTFAAVEGWRIWRDYRDAFHNAANMVTNLAQATAQHAEDAIRQVDSISAALVERVEGDGFEHLDRKRLHGLLSQQVRIIPQLHGLFIYDSHGRWLVTDRSATPPAANNGDRDYFIYHRDHPDSAIRIGAVVRSRSTGDLIVPISRRLNYPDGRFAGVLLGTIKVDWFVRYYGEFKIDERGALVLAKRDGTILVRRPFVEPLLERNLANSDIFKHHLPYAPQGLVEAVAVVDGTPRLYAYRALASYPLVVEAGLSRESIIAPWRQDAIKSLLVLLVLVMVLALFGWVVLRQVRERIVIERALHQAHQTLKTLALTDSLTGLGNRRRLDAVFEAELRRARRQAYPVCVVMLDLDHFKAYNDRYGHGAGDQCLQRVGELLRQAAQRPADLAVRYGGEEFTLLLPDTDVRGAKVFVESLQQALRKEMMVHAGSPLGIVSFSAGIAVAEPARSEQSAQQLLEAADAALYEAKRQGRDRYAVADPEVQHGDAGSPA